MSFQWITELFRSSKHRAATRTRILPGVPVHQSGHHTVVLTEAEPLGVTFEPSHRTTQITPLGGTGGGRYGGATKEVAGPM